MAKLAIVSLNLFLVLALKIFFGGDVSVVQKMQPNIKPGDVLTVELEITKGDREGFAKWQQKLPEGFIASSIETNGATFSFKNQEIKVIWMALPVSESFSITYQIETSPDIAQKDYNLAGKFSFIEENERRDISSEVFILTVDDEATAVAQNTEEEEEAPSFGEDLFDNDDEMITEVVEEVEDVVETEETTDSNNELATKVSATEESMKSQNEVVKTNAAQDDFVEITREVEHINDGNYVVTLSISKGQLNSFGKVEDYLPPNYTASENESNDGIFSFKGNVMKILWMTLPEQENIEVKYNMVSTSDELETGVVHGVFSYLNVDESNQTKLAPTEFKNYLAKEDEVLAAQEESQEKEDKEEQTETTNLDQEQLVSSTSEPNDVETIEPNTADLAKTTEEDLIEDITNIPSPETAVSYKVQIAASKKEVTQQYFIDRHQVSEPVSIEFHETWYKYTIGSFPIYKGARDKRNQVWAADNKINDAFVTAYNSGERISVQEALMISKQKWFK